MRYEHLRDHVTPDSPRWREVAVEAVLRARLMAHCGQLSDPAWTKVTDSVADQLDALSDPG